MAKVKIVQIALCMNNDEQVSEYLDDKGRVWYPTGHYEESTVAVEDGVVNKKVWVTEWKQLELPDEPK